jgi:hypothetical protein
MKEHLSSEQISKWIAGDRNPDDEQHLRECAQCSTEVARMDELLTEFRSSVVSWIARHQGAGVPNRWQPLERRHSYAGGTLRWKLVAAALCTAIALPIGKYACDRQREAEAHRADIQLWEQVNTQISRPVPAPLEPLMKLVVWEPAASELKTVK